MTRRIRTGRRIGVLAMSAIVALVATLVAADPDPAVAANPQSCVRWAEPDGSDSGAGTETSPWRTFAHAAEAVPDAGCTVWFGPGTYSGTTQIKRRFATPTTFRAVDPYRAVLEATGTVVDIDGARNVVLEGFRIRHAGPSAVGHVVIVDQGDGKWAEDVTLRNNIIHDSRENDLLKVHNGVRRAVVEGNLFFNQGNSEQHVDVNSVTDVVIQDNIFYNDFASSGRTDGEDAKHFIIVKDSNGGADGLLGSRRITIRRNVFLNWQGGRETLVKVGNDGKPYHEADTVDVVNNLVIGNSRDEARTSFGVAGARRVTFANNTVVGDFPSSSYGFVLEAKGLNPDNEDITFVNNVWADPTATMGDFSDGDAGATLRARLQNNLYWNGGAAIPDGDLLSPLTDDPTPHVRNPRIPTNDVVLPKWLGDRFASGTASIRAEFLRLVGAHGRPELSSAVRGRADPSRAPDHDILGRPRGASPDLGAYEVDPAQGSDDPCPGIETNFDDVVAGQFYSEAVRWLVCEGITSGTSPTTFSPHQPVTRAQMATFLWRFSGQPTPASTVPFSDVAPGRFYSTAVAWLLETGITTGTSPTTFSPHQTVTRAQMATFLWRFSGQPTPASTVPFSDVAPGRFYSTAVAWLLETGITTGTSPTTFSPHQTVTRAQMATFLWRFSLHDAEQ